MSTPVLGLPLDRESTALLCHEANRVLSSLAGERDTLPWLALSEHVRQSVRSGVDHARGNPDITPREMHENWVKFKTAAGWTYGPFKDERLKQHPCLMPYDELPHDQRLKDVLFLAIVRAMT
jgi:hypothetical protein